MSGYCKHCGYDRCQCDEIEKDLRKLEKQGFMNETDTPTPRTDAEIINLKLIGRPLTIDLQKITKHSETLERELTSSREELREANKSLNTVRTEYINMTTRWREVTEQRDRLQEVIKSRDVDRAYNDTKWNELRDQRDRLAELLEKSLKYIHTCPFKANCIEALQSLTTNNPDQERKSPALDGSI